MNIHVHNLSLNTGEGDLRKLFAAYGEVSSAVITRDKRTGRSRGSARISMTNDTQAKAAITGLNNTMLTYKKISVLEFKQGIGDYIH
jgi:RNA recognition motif-containing protein